MRVKEKFSSREPLTLAAFLTSDDRGSDGAVERAAHLAYEADQKLGRLLAALVESGSFTFAEACAIAGVSGYGAELVP